MPPNVHVTVTEKGAIDHAWAKAVQDSLQGPAAAADQGSPSGQPAAAADVAARRPAFKRCLGMPSPRDNGLHTQPLSQQLGPLIEELHIGKRRRHDAYLDFEQPDICEVCGLARSADDCLKPASSWQEIEPHLSLEPEFSCLITCADTAQACCQGRTYRHAWSTA